MTATLSTHVLDTEQGRPVEGVRVELYCGQKLVAGAETEGDGRIAELAEVEAGRYRLVFRPRSPYFRRVELELDLDEGHAGRSTAAASTGC
jgi:5-hydroxyisourate hydrolase-like protein (transthyretin family)